jgi:ornithine decarboxylase
VVGREVRNGRLWIYLDVGAYNGLIEAAQTNATTGYSVTVVNARTGRRRSAGARVRATITGPTCDSSDTILADAEVPADIAEQDRIYLGSCGAYTLCYASSFNGFAPPEPLIVG